MFFLFHKTVVFELFVLLNVGTIKRGVEICGNVVFFSQHVNLHNTKLVALFSSVIAHAK